jgi:hypothetical protein
VVLTATDPESVREHGHLAEWVHVEDYRPDEDGRGVVLDWGYPERMYIPWTSVLYVSFDDCECEQCERARAAA